MSLRRMPPARVPRRCRQAPAGGSGSARPTSGLLLAVVRSPAQHNPRRGDRGSEACSRYGGDSGGCSPGGAERGCRRRRGGPDSQRHLGSMRAGTGQGLTLAAVAAAGSRLVAVGSKGLIATATSSAPARWVTRSSRVRHDLRGVAWTGTRWVVVGDVGTILSSADARSRLVGGARVAGRPEGGSEPHRREP